MQKLIPIFLILILFSSCERKSGRRINEGNKINTCICENQLCDYCVKVIAITDGDTFKGLTNTNEEIKYRIYGIDAPEKKQAFGTKSKEYLSSLIFGKTVGIKVDSKDCYGRVIVWAITPDGKDVSAEMLKAGLAWHYKQYDNSEHYISIEDEAIKNKIGLWVEEKSIAPWIFRNKK
jgi:endonuclease YncB( thermonuclease family)